MAIISSFFLLPFSSPILPFSFSFSRRYFLHLLPMAASPEHFHDKAPAFRAPPPSPIATASGRRSAVSNDDEFIEFLENSFRVPDLVLPDPLFPKEISAGNPPEIDFLSLVSAEAGSVAQLLESASAIGCFQLVNHGIGGDMVGSTRSAAAEIFQMPAEKKKVAARSPEMMYGFEEEGPETMVEEFYWASRDEGLKAAMEGIWPDRFSNFRQKTKSLSTAIEMIASKVAEILVQNANADKSCRRRIEGGGGDVVVCLYKHGQSVSAGHRANSLKSDVIRMLIRRSDYSHALCMHLSDGCSEFHFYSKKGWLSFSPTHQAIVVTVGDQIQASSDGFYKHVIGRPIFHKKEDEAISMAFLYSPPHIPVPNFSSVRGADKFISLRQQILVAICLTLFCEFLLHISQASSN